MLNPAGGKDSPNQAILQLEQLLNNQNISLSATAACLFAHKRCRLVDQEAVEMLEMNVDSKQAYVLHLCRARATAKYRPLICSAAKSVDLLQASTFYCHAGEFDKARELVDIILEREASNAQAQALRGWIDLLCGREAMANKSKRYFEAAKNSADDGALLSALLGMAKFYQKKRARSTEEKQENLSQAMECLLEAWAKFQWFLPSLLEEVKVYMMMGKWTEAVDTAQRVLGQDARNIEAMRFVIVHHLARESKYQEAQQQIQSMIEVIARYEPKNAALLYSISQSISRLAGRHPGVLTLTIRMSKMARDLSPEMSEYACEVGEQLLMLGQVAEANRAFRDATRLDESNMEAHYGIIKCQILEGHLEDAEQQLEFLNEIQMSVGSNPALTHLSAMLEWAKNKNKSAAVKLLDETKNLHLEQLDDVEMGYDYFTVLNPDLMVEITKAYLQHCPTEPVPAGSDQDPTLDKGIEILEVVLEFVPGLIEAQLLLAKTKYITNDLDGAQRQIKQCLDLDPNYSEANVLLAQIYLAEHQYKDAMAALEQALAHNFEIRNSPLYSIVKAKVLEASGELAEAEEILNSAMELPGIRSIGGATHVAHRERAAIYVQLAQTQLKLNKLDDALKVTKEAKGLFVGTPEEMTVMIVDCDVAIARGDFRAAVGRLKNISADSAHFVAAQTTLADVYLNHRNDKKRYIECYKSLAKAAPGARTAIALGEACMRVNEPQEAIKSFEMALQHNKSDTGLRSKIGKALVATHDYDNAKIYYQEALQEQPNDTTLSLELAELAMRLGRRNPPEYHFAEQVLLDSKNALGFGDSHAITNNVKVHMMLAELYKEQGKMEDATEALMQARSLQSRLKSEAPEVKKMGVQICMTLANYFRESAKTSSERDALQSRALSFFGEALKHDNTHEGALVALAELHKERNELDLCQQQCVTLLRIDSTNDQASMMLAELMFMKKETDSAIFHFQQLLEKRPTYYIALEKLLRLLRHAGKLSEAPRYVEVRLLPLASPLSQMAAG